MTYNKKEYLIKKVAIFALAIAMFAWPFNGNSETLIPGPSKVIDEDKVKIPDTAGPTDRISVMVYFHPTANRGLVRAFSKARGGIVKYEYKRVLSRVMNLRNIPSQAVSALKKIPGVERVEEDRYHPHLINLHRSTPLINGLQSQINTAGLSVDGSGVRVCVCDTGIDMNHVMYADRIDTAASYDFANDDPNPEDDHGHGAHVAGIAVGGTGLTFNPCNEATAPPFQGVAPKATLIGVKILDANGGGYDSDIVAGIDHCADPDLPGGPADVINLSIGAYEFSGTCDTDIWAQAANNAVDAGVVVVAAAGNNGYSNALTSPACGSKVIAVGATYKYDYPTCEDPTRGSFPWCLNWSCTETCTDSFPDQDDLACFSNNSDNIDVAAPGSVIWSAMPDPEPDPPDNANYIRGMSGTSQASPHVAGLAALILDADPSLTPAQVREIIRMGAIDRGPVGFDPGYGYGRIDVINTLSLLNLCQGDVEPDGDVDGSDLAEYISDSMGIALEDFAANFGRNDCSF
jgi:serine protease AprX